MFDDLVSVLLVVGLAGGVGWLLGVVAFFRAGRALAEVAVLRARLAGMPAEGLVPAGMADVPVARPSPWAVPEPVIVEPVVGEPVEVEPVEVEPLMGEPVMAEVAPVRPRRDFEELVATRWGVWLGAAALLLAGVFLVRYAVDAGLLGPAVRCAGAAVLGAALISGGDWVRRRPVAGLPFPDQVPAALVAGGVAVLFGAGYGAGVLYGLVPLLVGFGLMAAVSLAGVALSLRFGPLVAAVGIVGAFVTPLLVQTNTPSWPGLFGYLLFVAAAGLAVVRFSAWVWLGWATTVAGAGWVVIALLSGVGTEAWAPALFVPALAAVHLVLLPGAALDGTVGRRLAFVPVLALGLAGLLLCFDVPGVATRAGVLLLAPVCLLAAAREDRLARLPFVPAALLLLLLAGWGLPPWGPTGEAIEIEGAVAAVLPGALVPGVLEPFLWTGLGMAALFAAAGLWGERWSPGGQAARPLPWAAMVAAVPVLVLATGFWRVRGFQPDWLWAGAALALAAGLVGAAAVARRDGGDWARQRAGAHAAGAVAALALGFAALLSAQWLTTALALLVPALAVIEARADLPPLRRIAGVLAGVALVRLLANGAVLDYALDGLPVLNGRAPAYAVAAAAFWWAARVFRRRGDDGVVALLELGSVGFVTALVMLEIRQWATGGRPGDPDASFLEVATQVGALFVLTAGCVALVERTGRPALLWASRVLGLAALAGGVGLLLLNPFAIPVELGQVPVLDALLPGYLVPAVLAGWLAGRPGAGKWTRRGLAGYALLAAFAWVTLEVSHAVHPGEKLNNAAIEQGELWAWSGGWMLLGLGLLAVGLSRGRRDLRLAGLGLVGLVTAKVFLVDMAGLTGLWRVVSFLGLGLALIGLGRAYQRLGGQGREQGPPT